MKRSLITLCALGMGLLASGVASATPITSAGATVTSGPLTFNNFTCVFTYINNGSGACASVDGSAISNGIQFSTPLNTLGASAADLALTFDVKSTTAVSSVGLTFNSSFMGLQVNSVTEDVYASEGGKLIAQAVVYTGSNGNVWTDSINLGGNYTSLYITKDIDLVGYASKSQGTLSIVDQTFTGSASPEPISVSLIGGGLALIGLVRMRKNKNSN